MDKKLVRTILALLSLCKTPPENKEKMEKSRNGDDDDNDRQTRDDRWSYRGTTHKGQVDR